MDSVPQFQRYEAMYRSLSGELIALKVNHFKWIILKSPLKKYNNDPMFFPLKNIKSPLKKQKWPQIFQKAFIVIFGDHFVFI